MSSRSTRARGWSAVSTPLLCVSSTTDDQALMTQTTHIQPTITSSTEHRILYHYWHLERDRARLKAAQRSAAVLPLGSGAVAGCAYPISRVLLQGTLGFDAISPNSI